MPYSGASDSSLPENVKKMPTKKKKKWVAIFNDTYNGCIDDGGSTDSCETKAFKAANGAVKQILEQGAAMAIKDREIFHRIWDGFLNSVGFTENEDVYSLISRNSRTSKKVERSMSMSRLREQLWYALDEAEGGWAYPIDIFVGDNGTDIFSIVAQSGKLYHVPISVTQETITLGEWIQVKEEFVPVTQNRFFIRRQKDGLYRWTAIAATSVLNRVAQIDSVKLFDCFVQQAEKHGKYPRLDFYHYGESDPDAWEFGTADYLARDGVCYIVSGLFDEDHPLAQATIRACEAGEDEWGCSIEFYAYSEPEKILVDPEVVVPVYNEGENTRVSVVLEEDAAGLFTRIGVKEGVNRAMDKRAREALEKLYGEDTEGLETFLDQFEEGVDETNKRVKNDKLIHRTTEVAEGESEEDQEDESDEEEFETVLDESAVAAVAQQVISNPEFQTLMRSVEDIKKSVAESLVVRESDSKKIQKLETDNAKLRTAVERLSKDEGEKKTEYLQDLPAKKRRQVMTVRATETRKEADDDEDSDDILEDFEAIAQRTLDKLPSY